MSQESERTSGSDRPSVTRRGGTLGRLERILVMVPWLLDHPGVSVSEVTERFGVPEAELLADLDVLGYCGLPGYGGGDLIEASVAGDRVVVRMADFFHRPLRLNVREALTLVLAAQTLAAVTGLPESEALRSALDKLHAALGAATGGSTSGAGGRGRARGTGADTGVESGPESAGPHVAVDLSAPGEQHLAALRQAVADQRVVRLTYRSASKAEVAEREVEPWGLVGRLGSWYLQGYCRRAEGSRDFRLDRIRDLAVTTEVLPARLGAPVPHGPPVYEPGPDDEQIVLDLSPDAWWVAEWLVVDDVADQGAQRRVTLRTGERAWLVRLLLGLGDTARVVSPGDLADDVAALASATLARYRDGG